MRVFALTVILAGGLGLVAMTGAATMGAAAAPAKGGLCKVVCAPAPQAKAKAVRAKPVRVTSARAKPVHSKSVRARWIHIRPQMRHAAHYDLHHHAKRHDYYRETENFRDERRGFWRQAPNDAAIPAPVPYGRPAYGPPPPPYAGPQGYYSEGYARDYQRSGSCNCDSGLEIDRQGWTGGVGYAGSAEPFVDGYGMVHYASGSAPNGPTYNSYGQSFQANPSRPGPFQPRVMGGFAPGGPHMGGSFGPHR
jgi:hypothetical protein